jgi:prevent-host-death family protein
MTYDEKMNSVNVHEAKTHLSKLLERVEHGEEIEIRRNGEAVAKLVPHQDPSKLEPRKFGAWADEDVWIAPDFDETPEEVLRDFGMLDD